jgi:hypothetical protein
MTVYHPMATIYRMAREVLQEAEDIADAEGIEVPHVRMKLVTRQEAAR